MAILQQTQRLARVPQVAVEGDRLVLVLHVAYAFVPAGFLLTGLSNVWAAVPASAGIHAWTAGADSAIGVIRTRLFPVVTAEGAVVLSQGSAIVYAASRAETEQIAQWLHENGLTREHGDELLPVYASLQQSSFPTLYASTNAYDDFAESFATNVHCVLLRRTWQSRVLRDGAVQHVTDYFWASPRSAPKRAFMERLLAPA